MAVPYHTHTFEIPAATKEDVLAGVANDKALTPQSVGTAAAKNIEDFATADQGAKADNSVQPEDLAKVATTGDYNDLNHRPTLGSAASHDATEFATALQPAGVQSAAHHQASEFATAAQGQKADSAVQPGSLKGLAYKDKVKVADIDATGTPNSTTFLAGDGKWTVFGGAVFNASLLLRYAYGIYRGQPISFKATSQSLMIDALINPDHAINFKLDVTLYVGIPNGAASVVGGCTIYPSTSGQPQQYVVFGVTQNLVSGQTYSAYLQVSCMNDSASDSFQYKLAGASV